MNRKQKNDAYKAVLGLFRANYGAGLIKLSNESKKHFICKCEVAFWFYKSGWKVYTEPSFRSPYSGRADLVVVHTNGDAYAVEILCSETEKRFNNKEYPLPIIKIEADKWDFDSFCL